MMPTQYGMTVRPGYTHYNPRSYYYQLVKCYNCSIPHSHTVLTVSIITGLVGTARTTRTREETQLILRAESGRANAGTCLYVRTGLEICKKGKGTFIKRMTCRKHSLRIGRYANMDYIFASSLRGPKPRRLVTSYDIACQWSINAPSRLPMLPPLIRFNPKDLCFEEVIPKFHIAAHGKICQSIYSLNFQTGMGRTDGENIERGWAWMNPAALSTREMGEGSRQDSLDNQWGAWNWDRVVRMGEYEVH